MSLLAFAHVLLNRPMQRRFMSDPLVTGDGIIAAGAGTEEGELRCTRMLQK